MATSQTFGYTPTSHTHILTHTDTLVGTQGHRKCAKVLEHVFLEIAII